jgi:predicted nucleic acid-binding protein
MILSQALLGVHHLYIDTSPFIYYTENRPEFLAQVKAIFAYQEANDIDTITSVITLSECLTKPLKVNDPSLVSAYERFLLKTRNITLIPVTLQISRRSAVLRATYGLRTPDALHIATALETGCEAFLTNDVALKRVNELSVLILSEIVI